MLRLRKEKWAVVTGASSGIGLEFAKQLARQGYPLLLVARRRKRLFYVEWKMREAGVKCEALVADLAGEDGRKKLERWMGQHEVEVFINNAGFGLAGSFSGTDLSREQEMIDLNVYTLHTLMKTALQAMKQTGGGYILNVASSAGLFPGGPYMATYYATKAYVASLTQGVAEELRLEGSSMYVGCLCPGPVNTEFNEVADVAFALKGISAKQCVDECLAGMRKKKTVIIPTGQMRMAILGQRFAPQRLLIRMVGHQQKKKLEK